MTPYYEEGGITIYHGDCREVLSDVRADVVLTDPPYGIGVHYGGSYNDTRADYWPWMRDTIAAMRSVCPRVAFTHQVAALREITDWDWLAVWHKPASQAGRLGNSMLFPSWEPILLYGIHNVSDLGEFSGDVFTVRTEPTERAGLRGRDSWNSVRVEGHPAPKPLRLMQQLLRIVGQGADTVLDPFMGSGTTLLAAKNLNRSAIGIEIEERYCEIAAKRLAQRVFDLFPAAPASKVEVEP